MHTTPPVEITVSRHFLAWLYDQNISLAFTTYQTNRLFLLGLKQDGSLSTFERLFDHPMGLFATPDSLYMSTRSILWQLENALPGGEMHEGYDRLYIPRRCHTTGDLDVHDIALDGDGRVIFVNTLFSCLARMSERYSFEPAWVPPFISRLTAEDRCHLNGLAMEDGAPRYVTAVSRSDVPSGWRERRESGGCLLDVSTSEILLRELSMPHSPRLHQGRLWLLNSGTGELGYYDREKGAFEAIVFCPGYLRGLAFHGDYAIIGLSKPRREKAFQGLLLDGNLQAKDAEARCGLYVVDLRSGDIAHWVQIEGVVLELYDVGVLEGVRRPMALGFKTDEIDRLITFEDKTGLRFQSLEVAERDTSQARPPAVPVPRPEAPAELVVPAKVYRFRFSPDITVDAALRMYEDLTFPSLREQSGREDIREPMTAVLAMSEAQPVGLALGEYQPGGPGGLLRSLFVSTDHRRRGVASGMLRHLENALIRLGCSYLEWSYNSQWSSLPAIQGILQRDGWQAATLHRHSYHGVAEKLLRATHFKNASLPAGYTIFPWQELSAAERQAVIARQAAEGWYPSHLDPFRREGMRELSNSLGLRHQGQVVGWLVTHRSTPETVHYSCLFISPELRPLGRANLAVPLIAAALQRQVFSDIPLLSFEVGLQEKPVLQFIRSFLEPYLEAKDEVWLSRKILVSEGQ